MMNIGIFISHAWRYNDCYEKLHEWYVQDSGGWSLGGEVVHFSDFSIPKSHPIHSVGSSQDIHRAIILEMRKADVVVCPTGMWATHSDWIGKEIAAVKRLRLKLLAVNPWRQKRGSGIVQRAADAGPVGWYKESVIRRTVELFRDLKSERQLAELPQPATTSRNVEMNSHLANALIDNPTSCPGRNHLADLFNAPPNTSRNAIADALSRRGLEESATTRNSRNALVDYLNTSPSQSGSGILGAFSNKAETPHETLIRLIRERKTQ